MNSPEPSLDQSLYDAANSAWSAIADATPVKTRKPRLRKPKISSPKAPPKKKGPKPGSRSWEKGIAAAIAKNKISQNEAQRASLAKANERFKELATERRSAYELNPKRCLHCTLPLDYKRVTKESAVFCNRHCSATYNNLNRLGQRRSRPTETATRWPVRMSTEKVHEPVDLAPVLTTSSPIRVWNLAISVYPLANDPKMFFIGESVHRMVEFDQVKDTPFDLSYRSYSNSEIWLQLARIANGCGLSDWSKALQANVRCFRENNGVQKSLAGYLIYLMTAQRSHPFGAPFLNKVWSGSLEMETDSLLDDWHYADEAVKPYFLAAKKAGLGRWWD